MVVMGGTFVDVRGDYYQVQNGSPTPRKPYVYSIAFFTFFFSKLRRSVKKLHTLNLEGS
jgi:hypothetical protein